MNTATEDMWTGASHSARYDRIYERLSVLRELFHSHGRLDDSNAKLDEVVKLLATYLAFRRAQIRTFPSVPDGKPGDASGREFIRELDAAFQDAAQLPAYRNQDGSSIFGAKPHMGLHDADAVLAVELVRTIKDFVDAAMSARRKGEAFDILNEAFGHFVRDNFRSNIEDAQYLTPPEVVDFMVDVALHDMGRDSPTDTKLTVLDPCCGVGSFLATFSHRFSTHPLAKKRKLYLIGQDKVDRMVRLTNVNLTLFDAIEHEISIGNSLLAGSPLDRSSGAVDLILTNPPFGARFARTDVLSAGEEFYPLLSPVSLPDGCLDSELLFIDRALALLKPGGRLLIVVPDGVVSAKGLPALLRARIQAKAHVRMVLELPPVTFAQAGTRTRTVVLFLQKPSRQSHSQSVFIAKAEHLGFEVSSRKGVQVKVLEGDNELPKILEAFKAPPKKMTNATSFVALREPSAVFVTTDLFFRDGWTPSRLSADRFGAETDLASMPGITPRPLQEIAVLQSDNRRPIRATANHAYISILHVIGDGVLDVGSALNYCPKTPGLLVHPGEVLLSRINPRIPRVMVVPDLGRPTLCSSEFEILTPKDALDEYQLAFLLLTPIVGTQIASLTTGTSASHSRVRSEDLASVIMPVPDQSNRVGREIERLMSEYRDTYTKLTLALLEMQKLRSRFDNVLDRNGK